MTKEVKKDKKEDTISLDEAFVKEDDRVLDPSLIDKSIVERMPQPTGWRMLVLPFRMNEKTKGGVLLGTETIDRQQVASQCGNVIAMGPDCYNDPKRFNDGPWCKVGDWVVFARYAGSRIEIDGGEVRLLNDDEILATVQDPTDILHKF